MRNVTRSAVLRYGSAIVAVVVSNIARLALDPFLGNRFPFATHFLAILVIACYAGLAPALVATGLGAASSIYLLMTPRPTLWIEGVENLFGMVLFLTVGVGIALLGGALRGARQVAEAEAEEAVRRREQSRITLECVGDAVLVTDAEGRVVSLNPAAEALTGWSSAEAAGQPLAAVFRIVNGVSGRPVEDPALRALRQGEGFDLADHTILIARDGTERPIDDSVAPIREATGGVVGAVLICRDITERRRAEQALIEADRRKDEFLATLAHELRNPLAPIRNGLQIMKIAAGDRATVDEARALIDRQVLHMCRLIDDLMDVSRIGRDKLELRRERVELAAIVRNAVDTSRTMVEAAGHDLALTLPDRPIYLEADATRLSQVFANLLNNAVKYTERGGEIAMTVERQGSDAVVVVRDNGVGIPAEMLPSIFNMFTQVDRSLERCAGRPGDRPVAGASADRVARRLGRGPQCRPRARQRIRGPAADRPARPAPTDDVRGR